MTRADPLPVDDRTLLHLLDALQTLDQGGRDGARVRLSFRSLDVEQIGHVYEGLLDHTAVRLTETALGLIGKLEPELPLADVEDWAAAGAVDERLAKETGRTAKAIRKLLEAEPDEETRARLRAVCDNDDALCDRIAPFHPLLRRDLRGDPTVLLGGSLTMRSRGCERRPRPRPRDRSGRAREGKATAATLPQSAAGALAAPRRPVRNDGAGSGR